MQVEPRWGSVNDGGYLSVGFTYGYKRLTLLGSMACHSSYN
jgi:hypothetical protein